MLVILYNNCVTECGVVFLKHNVGNTVTTVRSVTDCGVVFLKHNVGSAVTMLLIVVDGLRCLHFQHKHKPTISSHFPSLERYSYFFRSSYCLYVSIFELLN